VNASAENNCFRLTTIFKSMHIYAFYNNFSASRELSFKQLCAVRIALHVLVINIWNIYGERTFSVLNRVKN